jgi:membrane associated rhomboid family serine protease
MDEERSTPRPWGEAPPRERVLNAPWPSLLIVGAILASYAWQAWLGGGEHAVDAFGFTPQGLAKGRWVGFFTMMFIHGGWTHAIMNSLAALAFGPPVARLFGEDAKGAAGFIAFYLVCGMLANLGYAGLHPHDTTPVVGASGAVSGLVGAATRTFGREEGLSPIMSRPVMSLAGGWIAANLLLAITGASPLMPGAKIAWEAHVVGLVAGLLLIEPAVRLIRGRTS